MSPRSTLPRAQATRRLIAAGAVSGAVIAFFVVPSYGGSTAGHANANYRASYESAMKVAREVETGDAKTLYLPDGSHLHLSDLRLQGSKVVSDFQAKNAISRAGTTWGDPTTPAQAAAHTANAVKQRAQSEPTLTHVALDPVRTTYPANRYAMYDGCYGLKNPATGRWLTDTNATPNFTASLADATPFYFKASDLGQYMLFSPKATFLDSGSALSYGAKPTPASLWTVAQRSGNRFVFTNAGKSLTVGGGGKATTGGGTPLALRLITGCTAFPEARVNVVGNPTAGISPIQEVRGYIDAHTHGMAFEFLGGDVHCGRPWSPYGVTVALVDCPDHTATGGKGALMENFLSGNLQGHDPIGWPSFKDWPAPHSLTHEGTYYKWMERSWRGGQRLLVNLLVENNQLCTLYPLKRNSCDDMDSVRLQAKDMRLMQRYIDAQHGGPGHGWYRIVTTPDQARRVINAGKMAVVMGIETSVPFGCTSNPAKMALGQTCTKATLDSQLDAVRKMGVSQMELVNKFDNSLSGVAGDSGTTGNLVNSANQLETGSAWRMQHCAIQDPEVHDNDQNTAAPDQVPAEQQDALFGAVAQFSGAGLPALPIYPSPHHCNQLGLSDLGVYTIKGMATRHMLFDPDHMSVKARKAALDVIDQIHYSGVLSSHSWSTPDAYPRIYKEKGFLAPYAGDSAGFVAKWKRLMGWSNPQNYWGLGFGADINGLGAQGDPRADAAMNPVTYPFTGLGGVKIYKQVSGTRVYDINKDGVAQYGLYPDWVEDLRKQAGNAIVKDMARGPEAYLQMWERAYSIAPNACTNGGRHSVAFLKALKPGSTSWRVLRTAGQPDRRLGQRFTYCTTGGKVAVNFTRAGRLSSVAKL